MAGVLNIGVRPTVLHAGHRQIEAHLFDFDQMIYGENMRIHLLNRIRDERKFDSVQDLQLQIREDSLKARELCANHSR
jgi:riboflavin kinase/FMN adenylyltransferase